jgi:hypothetical protein
MLNSSSLLSLRSFATCKESVGGITSSSSELLQRRVDIGGDGSTAASRFILELDEGLLVAPNAARKSDARRITIIGMSLRCLAGR